VLCCAFAAWGLQRAGAQAPPVTFQPPAQAAFLAGPGKPPGTKVVRIYSGLGYFNDALATKLLPVLAKAFPSARGDPAQTVREAPVTAPPKMEQQTKVASAHP
jgi:hypothetical protein